MQTPTQDQRLTELKTADEVHTGLDAVANGLVGRIRRRGGALTQLMSAANEIDRLAPDYEHTGDRILREKLQECRQVFRRSRAVDRELLYSALAAIREAARRKVGLLSHTVQLAGALALHRGYLAEMATGEGKTLSAAMTAVLAAWTGRPLHIVTANDYLAQRDAEWMRPLCRFCGLEVGFVRGDFEHNRRQEAYSRDITYTTSKELVADFLRDRLKLGRFQHVAQRRIRSLFAPRLMDRFSPVLRGLHTAIVDEADHILIDEAVTPVILSSPHENEVFRQACLEAVPLADGFEQDRDFTIDHSYRSAELTSAGRAKIRDLAVTMPGLWRAPRRSEELIAQALEAKYLFERDKQYVIEDGKVVIVDEFTGRLMPQRTWREGLHQAVEAKEKLDPSDLSETSMRLSFQRFFRFFHRLSGMTGTAREAADELWQIYDLPVVCIPTHRPIQRKHLRPVFFPNADAKWAAIVEQIRNVHEIGRPILVGVRSVGRSERLSEMLHEQQLDHQVLNAVRHREEAQIIAMAGQEGQITIATNMAGRGTDIKLGRGVADKGGLHVLATEFHEGGRIDRQLYGRSGRQGDPGTAVTFASLEDELIVRYVPAAVRRCLNLQRPGKWCGPLLRHAQRVAENRAFRQRKQVLRTDNWIDESLSFAQGASRF